MPHFQSLKLIHKFIFLSPTRSPKLRGVITRNACYKRMERQGRRSCQRRTLSSRAPLAPIPGGSCLGGSFCLSYQQEHLPSRSGRRSLPRQDNHKEQNHKIYFSPPTSRWCSQGPFRIHLLPLPLQLSGCPNEKLRSAISKFSPSLIPLSTPHLQHPLKRKIDYYNQT